MIAGAGKKTAAAKPHFSRKRYLELLTRAMPRVITSGEELERATRLIEPYLFPERELPPEENAFVELMLKLIDDYQSKNSIIPQIAPHELLRALMEENDLSQADLLDVFGSRSRVSEAVSGKRAISKEQAKRLGDRFCVSPAAFI